MKLKLFSFWLILVFSTATFAKDKIILAFSFNGVVGVAGQIVTKGAYLAHQSLDRKIRDQYEIVTVNIGETLDSVKLSLNEEIKKARPIAIIGAVSSNQAFMINLISGAEKIPFLTPFATHPDVTKNNEYTFRTCFDDHLQASKLADFIHKDQKNGKGLVLYNEKQSYAIGIKNTFIESYQKYPGSQIEGLKFSTVDEVRNMLPLIEKMKPGFIVLPSYQTEAANILSILSEKLKGVKFYGTDSWGGGRLFHTILGGLPYVVEGFYVQHWSPDYPNAKNKVFLKLTKKDSFLAQYTSASMLAPAAVGYDALNFTIFAHQDSLSKKQDFIQSIKNVSYEGVTGKIQLKGAQTPSKALFIYKISNKDEIFYESYQ